MALMQTIALNTEGNMGCAFVRRKKVKLGARVARGRKAQPSMAVTLILGGTPKSYLTASDNTNHLCPIRITNSSIFSHFNDKKKTSKVYSSTKQYPIYEKRWRCDFFITPKWGTICPRISSPGQWCAKVSKVGTNSKLSPTAGMH